MKITHIDAAPTVPGIYSGLSNELYHSGPGLSKSSLDVLAKSPAHFYDRYLSPVKERREETAAMAFGTAFHTCVLEPHDFANWVVLDKVDRRTKEGKAAAEAAEAKASAQGGRVINRADMDVISAMNTAILSHPVAEHLETGVPELSVYWIDEDSGVFCRCRPDWLGSSAVVDLKTTDDASPKGFLRSAYIYRYWVQAAFYLDGLSANGIDVPYFIFAAVEKARPYPVVAYNPTHEMIQAGRREYRRLLKLYADCASSKTWPGYPLWADMELPSWAKERIDDFDDDAIA
jgi:hypothetical protein